MTLFWDESMEDDIGAFDRKRYPTILTENGYYQLTMERNRIVSERLPTVRERISKQDAGKQRDALLKQKRDLLKRVLLLNQRLNYSIVIPAMAMGECIWMDE